MTARPTACPCGGIMLADTEDWDVPRCFECWVAMGEPRHEPKSDCRAPIPMLLWCPECGERHMDIGEFATRPHHTHACQDCGMVWRPAPRVRRFSSTSTAHFRPDRRGEAR